MPPASIGKIYTPEENLLLVRLIEINDIVLNESTESPIKDLKQAAWHQITELYNKETEAERTENSLKERFRSMKKSLIRTLAANKEITDLAQHRLANLLMLQMNSVTDNDAVDKEMMEQDDDTDNSVKQESGNNMELVSIIDTSNEIPVNHDPSIASTSQSVAFPNVQSDLLSRLIIRGQNDNHLSPVKKRKNLKRVAFDENPVSDAQQQSKVAVLDADQQLRIKEDKLKLFEEKMRFDMELKQKQFEFEIQTKGAHLEAEANFKVKQFEVEMALKENQITLVNKKLESLALDMELKTMQIELLKLEMADKANNDTNNNVE